MCCMNNLCITIKFSTGDRIEIYAIEVLLRLPLLHKQRFKLDKLDIF